MTTLLSRGRSLSGLRALGVVRWLLPIALAVIALVFEWSEHAPEAGEALTPGFYGEIVLFALVGPIAVALTLGWVARLLAAYQATSAALASSNRDLEARIAERTRNLRTAGEELGAANRELARANDELRELDRLKSEFVSLVSHQLRAPLTNINGALEIVTQDSDRLPPGSQRTLQILTLEGQRLSGLIQTILDVSRLEAGRLTPRLGLVAVEPLLARTCASTLSAEPDRPLALTFEHALPLAWADETLLEEIVRNVLENAMHYSAAGSPVEVAAKAYDGRVEVSVADHGVGVPADEQARIFQSFHRIDSDEASVKGYGLGLYFADKLLRAQGGSIDVESPIWPDSDAPGTRFRFRIPVAPREADDVGPTTQNEVGEGGPAWPTS